jgi:hypothetical protein
MQRYKTEYKVVEVVLKPDKFGRRVLEVLETGDVVYIDTVNTTADTKYLFYGLDDKPLLCALYTPMIDIKPSRFSSIKIAWTPENDGKKVVLVIGREASLHLTPPQNVLARVVGVDYPVPIQQPVDVRHADSLIALPIDIQYRRKEALTLFSGTVTANGNTADINVEHFSAMELALKVTSVSGTNPALSVYIEGKFDTSGDYKVLVSQEGITTTGIWYFTITQLIFKTIRVRWVVTGESPSFTFRVDAVAMV